MVGGVNSPVRAYNAVGGEPLFIKYGSGAHVISENNKRYIDYVLSYGPLLAGHANEVSLRIYTMPLLKEQHLVRQRLKKLH